MADRYGKMSMQAIRDVARPRDIKTGRRKKQAIIKDLRAFDRNGGVAVQVDPPEKKLSKNLKEKWAKHMKENPIVFDEPRNRTVDRGPRRSTATKFFVVPFTPGCVEIHDDQGNRIAKVFQESQRKGLGGEIVHLNMMGNATRICELLTEHGVEE